ncbi:MAG: efflux RND transporter periplasmic adaptor subunit [Bacteroidota bacterium]|nr:efflux RND transporter periplasmic adaptor subunit [Bacteroidota bacterium]
MKKKSTIWIALILVLIVAFFLKLGFSKQSDKDSKKNGKDKKERKVDAYIVKPSLLINEISVSGSLMAFEEVDLKNEVAGRVVMINLPEGKFVKKGTLLVKLFDDDLRATLKKLQTQLAIQQQIYNRQSELLRVNGISQNDYEQTGLQLNSLKADIEVEKTLIRKTEVRAPFDGVIGLRSISVGAIITPSTLLATIRTENKMKLDFSVPEKYSSVIKPGMKIKFNMSNADIHYDATVMATEEGVDVSTRNLKVRAIVNSRSKDLLPGAFTDVTVRLSENNQALVIPTQAIVPSETYKSVIVARNGKAHFVQVITGIRQATNIEVTHGIQQGDTIITSGILFLKEGSKLRYSTVTK